MNLIINADDLGLSLGINKAVSDSCKYRTLTNASIMANGPFFDDAVENVVKKNPNLRIGLHINLSVGRPISKVSEIPLLLSKKNEFRFDFLGLLLAPYLFDRVKLEKQINQEIEEQILVVKNRGIELSHIDSHRHVHIIPYINKITRDLAKKYKIPRVREINENFLHSIKLFKIHAITNPKTLFCYILLRILNKFNNNSDDTYFLSIIMSCRLKEAFIDKLTSPSGYSNLELMLHPGNPEIDNKIDFLDKKIHKLVIPKYRTNEYKILKNKKLFKAMYY